MSLDGLRAWIGEVERKLGMRTRVFLVLTVVAIGVGAAATYLAIDARDNSVSKDDVRELQQQLETRIDEVAAGAPAAGTAPAEEAEPIEPEPPPEPKSGKKNKGGGGSESSGGASGTPNSATGGAASATELQELVEEAKRRSAEAETKQAGE